MKNKQSVNTTLGMFLLIVVSVILWVVLSYVTHEPTNTVEIGADSLKKLNELNQELGEEQ